MKPHIPDFFADRTIPWRFQDVIDFITHHFDVKNSEYIVGDKNNSINENQNALMVIAYAIDIGYTFEQLKALFSEHDHFALAIPESRKERNIFQLNIIYRKLLQFGYTQEAKVRDHMERIHIPKDILTLRLKK